jgi:hypothetical protein
MPQLWKEGRYMLEGPQGQFGSYGVERHLLILPGIKPWPSIPYTINIPAEQSLILTIMTVEVTLFYVAQSVKHLS